jgi:hypothetical protein
MEKTLTDWQSVDHGQCHATLYARERHELAEGVLLWANSNRLSSYERQAQLALRARSGCSIWEGTIVDRPI